jgi:hypothetical protein
MFFFFTALAQALVITIKNKLIQNTPAYFSNFPLPHVSGGIPTLDVRVMHRVFYQGTLTDWEVNSTQPFPSARVPWKTRDAQL